MANFIVTVRTNYFRVTDPEKFKSLMARTYGEDEIHVFERVADNGETFYGFGSYGGISGIVDDNDDDEDTSYDRFIDALQELVAPGDSIVIMEVGNEKLRYVSGFALIITKQRIESISLTDLALWKARELLEDPGYNTVFEY